jgi:hypothetical protein
MNGSRTVHQILAEWPMEFQSSLMSRCPLRPSQAKVSK